MFYLSGNVKVFCRARPLFEDEGPSIIEFPDNCTIRVNTSDNTLSNPKKEFEFDGVYGPQVGQGEILYCYCNLTLLKNCFQNQKKRRKTVSNKYSYICFYKCNLCIYSLERELIQ